MRALTFARRNALEILRDPLNLIFGLGFPMILLLLLSAIQASIPVPLFEIDHLSPGICVFGLSFLSLFSATLIAKDRQSSFLQRLYTTPLRSWEFILGYTLPLLPMALIQSALCYCLAMLLGLQPSIHIVFCLIAILPIALVYIAVGLLCGSLLNDKQVGGICGALLTNVSAWLSGIWFDLALVGGLFQRIAYLLPFVHGVEAERAILKGDAFAAFSSLLWVSAYALVLFALAIYFFLRQMKKQ